MLPPHPLAQQAAKEVMQKVHEYMRVHPESELHRQGKMFGVLVVEPTDSHPLKYMAAFSAQLDGSYYHEGFVPPVYAPASLPIGKGRADSQRLQRQYFADFLLTNGLGETKALTDIFADEKPIVPAEEWFNGTDRHTTERLHLPPSGAGECCAPKLLQYALTHNMRPACLAEFWVGAPSRTEVRQEGCFYAPCSGRCVPILKHMLRGIDVASTPAARQAEELCRQIAVLFEDEYLIVINKPAGLLSVPGKQDEPSVTSWLSAQRDERPVQAAHRLDQDTSGLLVLAKTPDAYRRLQSCFQRRDILKRYEAILAAKTENIDLQPEGTISLPLLPNPYDRPRQMVDMEHGKPAITHYVLRRRIADSRWFADLFPLTGRTHQLRVHAAHPLGLNAPIAGDRLYGETTGESGADRLMLHAAEIVFPHPADGREMHFCLPSPFA